MIEPGIILSVIERLQSQVLQLESEKDMLITELRRLRDQEQDKAVESEPDVFVDVVDGVQS